MRREVCEFRWVEVPYAQAARLLADQAAELLRPAAASAARAAGTATLEVEYHGRRVTREVVLDLGQPRVTDAPLPIVRLPVSWHAAVRSGLYPRMDGQLEAYPIGGDITQLSFQGTYQPPLGAVGDAADSLLLHRVAEQSVARFLRVVAQRLRRAWLADRAREGT